ncbi:hypothetical protein PsorP6_005527 [Peronosclerospora sorghi]|uniref:Uncharacterized protein n=1 Tax=Peronosclerospora sorghi TaxID=230839 RepID=A0ACC0W305_9STRA|nr:hypothetical protein PsorP6_005527 [Peronosclerospora sorghi]
MKRLITTRVTILVLQTVRFFAHEPRTRGCTCAQDKAGGGEKPPHDDVDEEPLVDPIVPVVIIEDVEHNEPDGEETEDVVERCTCFSIPVEIFATPENTAL